jgi:hypothetical protein
VVAINDNKLKGQIGIESKITFIGEPPVVNPKNSSSWWAVIFQALAGVNLDWLVILVYNC